MPAKTGLGKPSFVMMPTFLKLINQKMAAKTGLEAKLCYDADFVWYDADADLWAYAT